MFEKVKILKLKDVDDAVNIWCNSLRDNAYYQEFFDDNEVSDNLYFNYKRCVEACIMRGFSYGVFKGKTLVSILLAADYTQIGKEDANLFYDLFEGETERLCAMNVFCKEHGNVSHFIVAFCTEEKYRGKGYASILLNQYLEDVPKGITINTDCWEESSTLLEQFGFKGEEVKLKESSFYMGTKEV